MFLRYNAKITSFLGNVVESWFHYLLAVILGKSFIPFGQQFPQLSDGG